MRVTKVIREYIEEQVNKKYPIVDNNHPYMVACKKFEGIAEKQSEVFQKMIINEVKLLMETYGKELPQGWVLEPTYTAEHSDLITLRGHQAYNDSPLKNEYYAWIKSQKEKRKKAVQDIIVTLELGGNRADLEKMLGKLGA